MRSCTGKKNSSYSFCLCNVKITYTYAVYMQFKHMIYFLINALRFYFSSIEKYVEISSNPFSTRFKIYTLSNFTQYRYH